MRRTQFLKKMANAFRVNPIVAILGPRQCGKTTVAKQYIAEKAKSLPLENYFDLEDTTDLVRLASPKLALETLSGLIVIDEIQRIPDLFPILRVLIDRLRQKQHYLILGSASRELIQQTSETLAGRISYMELTPFDCLEVDNINQLWLRGGFPLSYLAKTNEDSYAWRQAYIRTFLEQDIPSFGFKVAPPALRRFWMMLTHYHGNIFNANEMGKSLGLSNKTIQSYVDLLSSTLMVRQLHPWFENIGKRQVKSRKIYFRDSGILHALMGIVDKSALLVHPKLGASWEGFALEQVIHYQEAEPEDCYFWAIHQEAELDLLIVKNNQRLGFEIKYTDTPRLTKSMQIAADTLKLDKLTVIYPGKKNFPLAKGIEAVGFDHYFQ